MKLYIVLFVLVGVALVGCDVIDAPYKKETTEPPKTDTSKFVRKILIEDFTGFKCPNCPDASDVAKALAENEKYKGQVYVLAVHAGSFAKPDPIPPFNYDFRTEAADALTKFYSVKQFPNGMINRVALDGNRLLNRDDWGSVVDNMSSNKADMAITLQNTYTEATQSLTVKVDLEYAKQQESDNYLSVYIVEDSIVQPQIDNRLPADQQKILDYVHNHVFRGTVNGAWSGEQISATAIEAGFKTTKTYTVTLNSDWRAKHCKVLAYVHKYDATYTPAEAGGQKLEILQVEEKDVMP